MEAVTLRNEKEEKKMSLILMLESAAIASFLL